MIVEREVIRVEPVHPQVVYVPVYDPGWVYGPWWWPAYPPYVVYPYPAGVAIAPGFIWFGAGLFVGAYWGSWGYWGWHNHACYVNRNYYAHGGRGRRRSLRRRSWQLRTGPSAEPSQAVVAAPAAGLSAEPSQRSPGRITPPIGEGLLTGTRSPGNGTASRQTVQPWRAGGISEGMKETGSNGVPGPAERAAHPARLADPTAWPGEPEDRTPWPAGRADPTA